MGWCCNQVPQKLFKELNITPTIEAYIQSTVLKKTLETISLEYTYIEDDMEVRDRVEDAVKRFGEASATGCQPQAIEKKDKEIYSINFLNKKSIVFAYTFIIFYEYKFF
ncbi:hypothetical protein TCON_0888 [Astathelohania contejeani]|uniref:Uncharacterized protein n=1 Tax=Astathelohania contejeani TaxID=164912 RepID=A0ABQ7I0J7_9MICR|nr:hypothetical protein TCON_0888 [Thelohania contejeani]